MTPFDRDAAPRAQLPAFCRRVVHTYILDENVIKIFFHTFIITTTSSCNLLFFENMKYIFTTEKTDIFQVRGTIIIIVTILG